MGPLRRKLGEQMAVAPRGDGRTAPGVALAAVAVMVGAANDVSYEDFERAELAAGRLVRSSAERELATPELGLAPPSDGAIALSVYSLPSDLVTVEEATALLGAVRGVAPERELVVLSDGEVLAALARESGLRLHLLDTRRRGYSPWPRDPLTLTRSADGNALALLRPNAQPGRERDSEMGRLLVAGLSPELDRSVGPLGWAIAPVPFHNGQLLFTDGATWASAHAFERRALELLGISRVPVETFDRAAGLDAWVDAIRRAARELERLYGQPVRLVHRLPDAGTVEERRDAMWRIGGGAGFDLDSLLTLLPQPDGGLVALVASLRAGDQLLAALPDRELEPLARWLDFRRGAGVLRTLAAAHHAGPRAEGLEQFLAEVATQLERDGVTVVRLPILLLPADVRPDGRGEDFLLGWNNAVLDLRDGRRAEAFATPIASADELARATYGRAGFRLDLLPPLRESVLRNGGYRCASNHLRRAR